MSSWTGEEVVEGLEKWLKVRRDEWAGDTYTHSAYDMLLDEVRQNAAEGFLPWQRISPEGIKSEEV